MMTLIKQISDIGAFGLVIFLILIGVKFAPKMLELWSRGVIAMEKIAEDMTAHQEEMRQTRTAIQTHDSGTAAHVVAIRGDIAGVKQDVLRVEGKIDRR